MSPQAALQGMQTKAGKIHTLRAGTSIESGEDAQEFRGMPLCHLGRSALPVELPQAAVPECLDHWPSVRCLSTIAHPSFARYCTRPCLTRPGADSKQLCGDNCEGGERDGRLDSDNPLQDAKLGFRGEEFEVSTGHRLCGDRASDGFGPTPFHAMGLEAVYQWHVLRPPACAAPAPGRGLPGGASSIPPRPSRAARWPVPWRRSVAPVH